MRLVDYICEQTDVVFADAGAFIAADKTSFDMSCDKAISYVNLWGDVYCPVDNVSFFKREIENVRHYAILRDLNENGAEKIILRELYHYRSWEKQSYKEVLKELFDYPDDILESVPYYYFNHHNDKPTLVQRLMSWLSGDVKCN